MKILIIEDAGFVARCMAEALKELGEVVLCTKSPEMPPLDEVKRLIGEADVVLLDHELNTAYTGKDLYPYCKGKKVIGISSTFEFGTSYQGCKKSMTGSPQRIQQFKEFVSKVIAK